ncbi:MAG: hypothetical protein AAFV53_10115 [Myxococcota bacterium]
MDRLRQHIFLFDGFGAVASMVGTAYLLPTVQPWIGLSTSSLLLLAAPAAVFMTYSLSCWMLCVRVVPWLSVIMVGNLSYCAFVMLHLAHHVDVVTPPGWAYFIGEVAVIVGVLSIERRVLMQARGEEAATHMAHTARST